MKTNPYIHINNVIAKLLEQHNKHGSIVLGVDFDNTLYNNLLDEPHEDIVKLVKTAKERGLTICVWTANKDRAFVDKFYKDNGLSYDYYNESPMYTGTTKPHFNLLLDDTAGLGYTVTILETILWLLRD